MSEDRRPELGAQGRFSDKALGIGWGWFRKFYGQLCAGCTHAEYHHKGAKEPGCSYHGSCSCGAFTADGR